MSRLAKMRDSKGRVWNVLIQEKTDSCGPAAVTIVEYYSKGRPISEDRTRYISGLYPGGWSPDGHSGTQLSNLRYVLEGSDGLTTTRHQVQDQAATLLADVETEKPAIVRVQWAKGGGHFVVCPRMYPDGTTVFLDPLFGLVEMSDRTLPRYNAHQGQLSQHTLGPKWGTITHVVLVN